MFYETDAAFRGKIESLDFSPYAPVISGFSADPRVRPSTPGNNGLPRVEIDSYMELQDLSRTRMAEDLVLGSTPSSYALVRYPDPWTIGYQVDLKTSSNLRTARMEMNRMAEELFSICPGFNLEVFWTIGAYTIGGNVAFRLAEQPISFHGKGRLRKTLRFEADTWHFTEKVPRIIGSIAYRVFEISNDVGFVINSKVDDPDRV